MRLTTATSGRPATTDNSASRFQTCAPEAGRSPAQRRVAEYLRALGLVDSRRVEALSSEIVRAAAPRDDGLLRPDDAVAEAQRTVEAFWLDVFGAQAERVEPLWRRAFLEAHPEVFLGEPEVARRAAADFGDPFEGRPPARARFAQQSFGSAQLPGWARALAGPAALTSLATALLGYGLAASGPIGALEVLWCASFAFLFGFAALGFATATRGFASLAGQADPPELACAHTLPRSAVVMPIYHEDAERVFAALAAMREALEQTPGGGAMELFVLSDSRDPVHIAEEERAWRRVVGASESPIPLFYRRRVHNVHQKAGNLAEFLERWGYRYEYMIVLDADSLMAAETMVQLVRRMHASPQLGLLQAPLSLHRGTTLFARALQFVASAVGPLFMRGLAAWSEQCGNYYGHNAVVRVQAFLESCALPTLAGQPPLGGHILSHDFVEAALLCRAGWSVELAADLTGSWEELPSTLPEYVARDRRWCQGNLQHLKLVFTEGLKPMSRIHMLSGAAAYLAGPVWLVFVVVGLHLATARSDALVPPTIALALTLTTAALLVSPRLLGLLRLGLEPGQGPLHGGLPRAAASTLMELAVAGALAPLMMVHHVAIVASILAGRATVWGARTRGARAPWRRIAHAELSATLAGLALLGWLVWTGATPTTYLVLSPLWLPLSAAIPLAWVVSSEWAGELACRLGLFLSPSEVCPEPLAVRAEELRVLTAMDEAARYRDLILDPLLVQGQLVRLDGVARPALAQRTLEPPREPELQRLCERVLASGPTVLSGSEWELLVRNVAALRWLHREAWRRWPVESWDLAREQPQLPPESATSPGSHRRRISSVPPGTRAAPLPDWSDEFAAAHPRQPLRKHPG